MKLPGRSVRKRLVASGVPALIVAAVLAAASLLGVLGATRARVGDLLFAVRPAAAARATVIVGIDQKSYQALLPLHGPLSAWPRTLYAKAPVQSAKTTSWVGIFVPERFKPRADVDLVIYLHGLLGPCASPGPNIDRYWDTGLASSKLAFGQGPSALREALNGSGKSAIPAPVATRLRTASTERVRNATCGLAVKAERSLPVFSSVSSTVSMISGSGTMSDTEMMSAPARRCPRGSQSR